jgi:hypothetical protein
MLELQYEKHYLRGWSGLSRLKNIKSGSLESLYYYQGLKDYAENLPHRHIPEPISAYNCTCCGKKVSAYSFGGGSHSFNCYSCNLFSEIDGGRGGITVIPRHLNETVKYIDNFYSNQTEDQTRKSKVQNIKLFISALSKSGVDYYVRIQNPYSHLFNKNPNYTECLLYFNWNRGKFRENTEVLISSLPQNIGSVCFCFDTMSFSYFAFRNEGLPDFCLSSVFILPKDGGFLNEFQDIIRFTQNNPTDEEIDNFIKSLPEYWKTDSPLPDVFISI